MLGLMMMLTVGMVGMCVIRRSVVSYSAAHGLEPSRLLCPCGRDTVG